MTEVQAYVEQLVRRQRAEIKRQLLAHRRRGVRFCLWRGVTGWFALAYTGRDSSWCVIRDDQRDALSQLLSMLSAEGVASTVPPPAEVAP